ncbi:AraC family transcriptional regulator [Desulfoluna butyratoxydans]|uniref:Dna binding hth domain arac-type n=1 Tax=Desulfoluna butyratoxydans TaxID=231438 RepID=A0A4U8YT08_9BACT|nr:AraC family transcriptional regulator [Desulfoluna butyratoxydans]VFQ47051.1 dna binding hth domain arac-type [Desulfoluna butyratoxydans]
MHAPNTDHALRLNRALDHIDAHLSENLTLDDVARVACYSPFHFHRIFKATVGETLNRYIQRLRVEKAAAMLLLSAETITEIALACGFSSSATFARAFRDFYGMNAGEWRKSGDLRNSKKCKTDHKIRKAAVVKAVYDASTLHQWRLYMDETLNTTIRVEPLEEMEVAYVRHIGPYQGNGELFDRLFNRLFTWAGPRQLLNFPETLTLSVYHDNEPLTEDDKLRLSVCITVPDGTPAEGDIGRMTLTGGTYAVARFHLLPSEYAAAWDAVMADWLPQSGYRSDDRPCLEIYRSAPGEHPDGRHTVDICVPVKPA